jgi:exoribonuclease R
MESHQLWDYVDARVSTIYLPDKRRTMLPPMISDNTCSLLANQVRQALTMKVTVDFNGLLLCEPSFVTEEICVAHNYAYEEPRLLKNRHYQMLLDITRKMSAEITDSHDVVEYWMVYMNAKCGELLASRKRGVFRTAVIVEGDERGMRNIIKDWNKTRCEYVAFDDANPANLRHDLLGVDTYAQITSPIRRLVDLINQTIFIREFLMDTSHEVEHPLMKWLGRMDVLNAKMKSIRKVQTECELIEKCYNERDFLQRTYSGVVFRKLDSSALGGNAYSVYVKEFRTFIKVMTTVEFDLYSNIDVKMYYFADEHEGRRKVQGEIAGSTQGRG